jgi:hypothetical protein
MRLIAAARNQQRGDERRRESASLYPPRVHTVILEETERYGE